MGSGNVIVITLVQEPLPDEIALPILGDVVSEGRYKQETSESSARISSPGGRTRFRRKAACASSFASALFSRRTWEMENASERASFRQVQCRE